MMFLMRRSSHCCPASSLLTAQDLTMPVSVVMMASGVWGACPSLPEGSGRRRGQDQASPRARGRVGSIVVLCVSRSSVGEALV